MRKIDWVLLATILGLLALIALVQTGCTTAYIPTPYGPATVTTPSWMTTNQFSLEIIDPTSGTMRVNTNRGVDPQATALVTGVVQAAVAGAIQGAKKP